MNGKGACLQIRTGTAGCPNDSLFLNAKTESAFIVF